MEKGENAGGQHFLLFQQSFLPILKRISVFKLNLFCCLQVFSIWTSLNKLSFGKDLNTNTINQPVLQAALDIITIILRSSQLPISDALVSTAFPAVAHCTLNTDDNSTMQVMYEFIGQISS